MNNKNQIMCQKDLIFEIDNNKRRMIRMYLQCKQNKNRRKSHKKLCLLKRKYKNISLILIL